MPDSNLDSNHWSLDKRVPIAFILALLVQAGGIIWWAQGVGKDIANASRRIDQIEAQRVNERLAALESQMIDSRSSLLRIESKLDRLIETRSGK